MSKNKKINHNGYVKASTLVFGGLLALTILAATGTNLNANANTIASSTASVNVASACTLTGVVPNGGEHDATITPGQSISNIGITNMTAACNDAGGYDIYAVGYSGNEWKNTNLISVQNNNTYTIATGTATSGDTSNWAMKLTAGNGDAATIVTTPTNYGAYAAVPNDYTKVAYYPAATAGTAGSSFSTTYQVFVSTTQAAGTYVGKVKYTLVHPQGAEAPIAGTTFDDAYAAAGKQKLNNYYKMQDMSSSICAAVTLEDGESETTLIDSRDNKTYTVSKLKDGNCWMTQNLDHDIKTDGTVTYNSTTTNLPSGVTWLPERATYDTNNTTWGTFGGTEINMELSNTRPESYDPGNLYVNPSMMEWWATGQQGSKPASATVTYGDSHYHLGNYYNWTAAVAMNDSSSLTLPGVVVEQSICPAGWTLPKAKKSTENPIPRSFLYLLVQYGWTTNGYKLNDNKKVYNSPLFIMPTSSWSGTSSNSLDFVGSSGYLWSSTTDQLSNQSLFLYTNTSGSVADPTAGATRGAGWTVRCIAL